MARDVLVRALAHAAAMGERWALQELKKTFPRREFRRFWCDVNGDVLKCRGKGSKSEWKRL